MRVALISCIAALLTGFASSQMSELEALAAKPKRCTYERALDMYGAYCGGLRLTKIPTLKGGIEILYLSDNKLKELQSHTFYSYTSIRFLYLADNSIYNVAEDTFNLLTSLETLDLSLNVIQNLPLSILNLPSLRKLYLSGNPLVTLEADIQKIPKPIKAPLELLDISNCRLFNVPEFGILPQLNFYNLSHNPLITISPTPFGKTCNLNKVDLTESMELIKTCDFHPTIMWFKETHVSIILDDYSRLNSEEFQRCPNYIINMAINATHHSCKKEYTKIQSVRTHWSKWWTIGGGLAGFSLAFILLLYVIHRLNVLQTKKVTSPETITKTGDKQATAALINTTEKKSLMA